MGRIKGHYEWDDDDLTPGRKKEGGLHQNLFDTDGSLKGSARFVPDDEAEDEPFVVTETVFITVDDRQTREAERAEIIAELVRLALRHGVPKAMPYVEQWWRDSARPAIDARRAKTLQRRERRHLRKRVRTEVVTAAEPPAQQHGQEIATVMAEERQDMSLAEAQARYLAAIAAKAYSDDQMRLVSGANIVGGDGGEQLKRMPTEVPSQQVLHVIETMATNPSLLGEEALAQLASILGRHRLDLQPLPQMAKASKPAAALREYLTDSGRRMPTPSRTTAAESTVRPRS